MKETALVIGLVFESIVLLLIAHYGGLGKTIFLVFASFIALRWVFLVKRIVEKK